MDRLMKIFKKILKQKPKTRVFEFSLNKFITTFDKMQHEAGWDITKKLYWGFYFLDKDYKKLESFGILLKEHGYRVIEMREIEGERLYLLHLEQVAIHTPQSFFDTCVNLATIAETHHIEIFDGWDVEQGDLTKGLQN